MFDNLIRLIYGNTGRFVTYRKGYFQPIDKRPLFLRLLSLLSDLEQFGIETVIEQRKTVVRLRERAKIALNQALYKVENKNGRGHYVWRHGCWVSGKEVETSFFHSYFNFGLGRVVSSNEEIRKHEATGKYLTTFNEAERICAQRKFEVKMEQKAKRRKGLEKAVLEMARGKRSLYREHIAQIPRDQKLMADREVAAKLFAR